MKHVMVFGGSGHIGAALLRHLDPNTYRVTIVSRNPQRPQDLAWDGKNLGDWAKHLESTDVVINLAGRRVHCRYNQANLQDMMDSRLDSTRILGEAIAGCSNPPAVWLQSSTATIYTHTFASANDDVTGELGGAEPGLPEVWKYSLEIAKNWEAELERAQTPGTRKVAMRMAVMMGIDRDSAFDIFSRLARLGLGGRLGAGNQFVSWIHEQDLVRAMEFLMTGDLSGPVNLASPHPLPQVEFSRELRRAWGVPFGLPATRHMVAAGAWLLDGDAEIVMKSRRVVPKRLTEAGFTFEFPVWRDAVRDLVTRMRRGAGRQGSG